MAKFIRARSEEQKAQRMAEIKAAAERQFAEHPYHEISLTTIADELGWSRANLYKYVATKEEIFLSLAMDKRDAYHAALFQAFPANSKPSAEESARIWAEIANKNQQHFVYGGILLMIIETNVTVEKLMIFKQTYYEQLDALTAQLSCALSIEPGRIAPLTLAIYHQAIGLTGTCLSNPLVCEALDRLGREFQEVDFRSSMQDFIELCIEGYQHKYPLAR